MDENEHKSGSNAQAFSMTDLEEILLAPGGADKAKAIVERFDRIEAELKADIAGGLPPERYETAKALTAALAAANDVLLKFIQSQHGDK